ncbi:MAG: DNA repair protein RadC [Chloroflexi bacterium]|nr:DNA repair protein RadC [Chloroflexota bacterium]
MGNIEYHVSIKALPLSERPRERLRDYGSSSLSNSELLAIILRSGSRSSSAIELASRLLSKYNGLAGLTKASIIEMQEENGIGEVKAIELKAVLELGRRLHSLQPDERPVVKSPDDVAYLLLAEMSYLDQEHLKVVLLNTKNQVTSISEIYKGSVNTSYVRISEVFRNAIKDNCPAIIIVHNHPSGDPTPSEEDIKITGQIVEAGKLLNIEVLDHIIIGQQKYISLKQKGIIK